MSDLALNGFLTGGAADEPPSPPPNPNRAAGRRPGGSAAAITDPCSECGRRFWSQKALFGHMRCHPDRQWRGINPPPHHRRLQLSLNQPSSSSSSPSRSQGKTHKRIRDLEHEAAAFLVMLSQGKARIVEEKESSNTGSQLGFQHFSVSLQGNMEQVPRSSSSRRQVPDLNLPPPCENN